MIAIDPHKASWTAAAVDASLQPLEIIRVAVSARATGVAAIRPTLARPTAGRSKVHQAWVLH